MFKEKDYLNQIELNHLSGKLTLVEMQNITEGKEPTTEAGKYVVETIQSDLITMDGFKGLVAHIEECSTNNLMQQWG